MKLLAALFPLRRNEWPIAMLFFGVYALFASGASIARSIGFTLLVGHHGKEILPIAFICVDLVVMLCSLFYAVYERRIASHTLLIGMLLAGTLFVGIARLSFLLPGNWPHAAFFIGFMVLQIMVFIHLGSFMASYFTALQLKRVSGFIYAGIPLGGMIGGTLLIQLLAISEAQSLILALAFSCLGAAMLAQRISQLYSPVETLRKRRNISPGKQLQQTLEFAKGSRLLLLMSLGMVLFVITSRLIEYQYQGIAYPMAYPDLQERAIFFGKYEIYANLGWFIIQILLTSRIILHLGIGASNLVHPLLQAIASFGLLLNFGFLTAVLAQFINQELRAGLRGPCHNLLFNALPQNLWGSTKAFLNGLIFPASTVLAGIILITTARWLNPATLQYILPSITLSLALLMVAIAILQWHSYQHGILGLLKGRSASPFAAHRRLAQQIHLALQSGNPTQIGIALDMIRLFPNEQFVPWIGKLLVNSRRYETKRHCAQTLALFPGSDSSLIYLLRSLRFERDPQTLALILAQLRSFPNKDTVAAIQHFLPHPHAHVFCAASKALLENHHYHDLATLQQKILLRLQLKNNRDLPQYLQLAGHLAQTHYYSHLQAFENHPQAKVRNAAFQAGLRLRRNAPETMTAELIAALSQDKARCLSALHALQEAPPLANWKPVCQLLKSPDAHLRKEARALLRTNIHAALAFLRPLLLAPETAPTARQEALAIAYEHLGQADKNSLIQLNQAAIKKMMHWQWVSLLFATQPSQQKTIAQLLAKRLHELRIFQLKNALILLFFQTQGNADFLKEICTSLESNTVGERSHALEALSNVSEKKISALLIRLYEEPAITKIVLEQCYFSFFDQALPTPSVDQAILDSEDPYLQAAWYSLHPPEKMQNFTLTPAARELLGLA